MSRQPVKARTIPVHVVMRHRGNACLAAAAIIAAFLAMALLGSGGTWSTWHTRLALVVATAALAALACYVAATLRAPHQTDLAQLTPSPRDEGSQVSHPGVTHLAPGSVLTPVGQGK